MENFEIKAVSHGLEKIDFHYIEDKHDKITVEDNIIINEINNEKKYIMLSYDRKVILEFELNVVFACKVELKNKDIDLNNLNETDLIENCKKRLRHVVNKASLLISVITHEAVGIPIISPPNFCEDENL